MGTNYQTMHLSHLTIITFFSFLSNILNNDILYYSFADQVSAGDDGMIQENDKLMAVKVINVSIIIMQGEYSSFKFFVYC